LLQHTPEQGAILLQQPSQVAQPARLRQVALRKRLPRTRYAQRHVVMLP